MACLYVGVLVAILCPLQSILATPQRPAYSLQAAVDELHRREAAKYPLNAPPTQFDDWDEDGDLFGHKNKNRNRHRVNKALAKYLDGDQDSYEHEGLRLGLGLPLGIETNEKRKRSSSLFRERDETNETPPSVFRERETHEHEEPATRNELTDQFLREIEEASQQERKEQYKDAIRQWWRRYDQRKLENDLANDEEELPQEAELFEQKKRMRMPPYYLLMQKKRSYPVLPWLPYNGDKKKRFPVAKRAIEEEESAAAAAASTSNLSKTDERVAEELSELFGKSLDSPATEEKKKRSAEEPITSTTTTPAATATALGDMRLEINFQRVNVTPVKETTSKPAVKPGGGELVQHGGHAGHHGHVSGMPLEYRHRKRSDHVHRSLSESEEHEHEPDEHDEEGEESSDEDEHDEFDDEEGEGDTEAEERRRKKKRAAGSSSSKHGQSPSVGHLMLRAKKSIDWSQYFGLDRKKKSTDQAADSLFKKHDGDSNINNDDNDDDADKKKRNLDTERLENMDQQLQSIEDFIIDETIKYTGAHEGLNSKADIHKIKDHVLSRLATAYSLEKMRRALEKLRQSAESKSHLLSNVIEPESEENSLDRYLSSRLKTEDIKPFESKKKRSGYLRYPEQPNDMEEALSLGINAYEPLNDAYLGNKNYIIGSNQCPIIESMAERCRGVDLISGDLNQELLPLCGVHQICYLCSASQLACDYQYLAEADSICGNSNECLSAARSVLMILRGTPGRQLGPRECLQNPCLYRAMREIGL